MQFYDQVSRWRQQIHQQPELGFKEEKTAQLVAQILRNQGLKVHENLGTTGVLGILTKGTSDRALGLRADMDALAICEQGDSPYKSTNHGVMHACGHDGHTAMLLGAVCRLAQQTEFDGTVYFIFQPAEEHGEGAKAMIADGLFRKWSMQQIFAMHNMPGVQAGKLLTRPGTIMASESGFEIRIYATGGHAAMPHKGTDPIVVGAQIVTALQTIVSRRLSSVQEPAVLSITEFTTNGTVNVIPSQVTIKGDTRCFSHQSLSQIRKDIEQITAGQCASAGVDYQYEFNNGFIATVNDAKATQEAIQAASVLVGPEQVDGFCSPYSTSEDFSFMLEQVPGCYLLIGNGLKGNVGSPLHSPMFDFNDEILMRGIDYWEALVKQQMPA